MPKVTVRVFAAFRELLRRRVIELNIAEEDIEGVIILIANNYEPRFVSTIIDPQTGQVRKGFSILLNGQDVSFLDGLKTRLRDGDTIALFSPVAGG